MSTIIFVRIFPWFGKSRVRLILDNQVKYGDIKKAVERKIKLKPGSDKLFGLFKLYQCPFMIPKELCSDSEVFPTESHFELGFMKLSFNKVEEMRILKDDDVAMSLIYWEARDMHDAGVIAKYPEESFDTFGTTSKMEHQSGHMIDYSIFVPLKEEEVISKLKREKTNLEYLKLGSDARNDYIESVSLENKKQFMKVMHSLTLYYWSHFYKVLGCTLCGDSARHLASCINLNKDFTIDVVLNQTCLSFIGMNSAGEFMKMLDFPWCNMHCVMKDMSKKIFSFQMLCEDRNGYISYMNISILTKRLDYLYSLAVHILGIQAKVLSRVDMSRPHRLTEEEVWAINYVRPPYIPDLHEFLSMALPSGFLQALLPSKSDITHQILPHRPKIRGDCTFVNKNFIPNILSMENTASLQQIIEFQAAASRKNVTFADDSLQGCGGQVIHGMGQERSVLHGRANLSRQEQGQANSTQKRETEKMCTGIMDKRLKSHRPINRTKSSHGIVMPLNYFFRTVIVHTFWKGPLTILVLHRDTTVKDVKRRVRTLLNLNSASLEIFGLFLCSELAFRHPICLCSDDDKLPDGRFCFRRLSFSTDFEWTLCKHDHEAMKHIFCEAKYMFDTGLMIPKPSETDIDTLKCLAEYCHINHVTNINVMERFMELFFQVSPYWWKYYYRVDSCNFFVECCDKPLTCVALTRDLLILLNDTATYSIEISLDRISRILTQTSPGGTSPEQFKLEILDYGVNEKGEVCERILTSVIVDTVHSRYFCSIAIHVFALHKKIQEREGQRISDTEYVNPTFKGPGYVFNSQVPVTQYLNKSFIGPIREYKLKYCS